MIPYATQLADTSNLLRVASPTFCDHIASHKQVNPADILDLATKVRLICGNDDILLLVRSLTVTSDSD